MVLATVLELFLDIFMLAVQNVDLSGCQLVTDLGIRALTRSCKNLESVNVSSCYELSDAGFESLGTCRRLQSLDACGCEQLTDTGLQALARGARYASVTSLTRQHASLFPPEEYRKCQVFWLLSSESTVFGSAIAMARGATHPGMQLSSQTHAGLQALCAGCLLWWFVLSSRSRSICVAQWYSISEKGMWALECIVFSRIDRTGTCGR